MILTVLTGTCVFFSTVADLFVTLLIHAKHVATISAIVVHEWLGVALNPEGPGTKLLRT